MGLADTIRPLALAIELPLYVFLLGALSAKTPLFKEKSQLVSTVRRDAPD
tara:strand:- start:791 stop:940 length:150 start_codon:yes stop_codon:yes gene_type:complete